MSEEHKIEEKKEEFIQNYRRYINRDGSERLLTWLEKSDFFKAPASTKYHGNYDGGLCEHSIDVYEMAVRLEGLYREDIRKQYLV